MPRIIFDQLKIKQKTGLDTRNALLYPHMDLDSCVMSSPVLKEDDDGSLLLFVKDIERGNFDEKMIKARVSYFKPYFTFDGVPEQTPNTWTEGLQSGGAGAAIAVDGQIHMSAYRPLAEKFRITIEANPPWWRVYLYEIRPEDILSAFGASYAAAQKDADKVASGLQQKADVLRLVERAYVDDRFLALDKTMEKMGLETIVVSSPMNLQEMAGIPFAYLESSPCLALYRKGGPVFLLTSAPLAQNFPVLTGVFPDIEAAVKTLPVKLNSTVGIEENHLSYDFYKALGLSDNDQAISAALRVWREQRAGWELPYYLLAARITVYGIETALERVKNALKQGKSLLETDVEQYLYDGYQEYVKARGLGSISVKPYFTVLHAGNRTRRPNLPQAFPVDSATKSLKIDSGVLVMDASGLIRGVSDLCRTLALDEAAEEIYAYFDKTMIDTTIPASVPGNDGDVVYRKGVGTLAAMKEKLVARNLVPDKAVLPDDYRRNIGHVLGKQEPATISFETGNHDVIEEGMVGCVEYQWPYYPYAIGVEDMFYIDRQKTFNITR